MMSTYVYKDFFTFTLYNDYVQSVIILHLVQLTFVTTKSLKNLFLWKTSVAEHLFKNMDGYYLIKQMILFHE